MPKDIKQIDKNALVVQSNALVEAHFKQEYTVQEQRTVLWLISEVHKEDYFSHDALDSYEKIGFKTIQITAEKYAELMRIPVDNVYRDAQKISSNLMEKVLVIKEKEGRKNSWFMVHWMSSMRYEDGIITATIAPELIPYLLDLKEKFTAFRLENILFLNSTYSIKIYQLLAQFKQIGERVITLDTLRSMFGIAQIPTYQRFGQLKNKILERSKREINAKTDLIFSYTSIKEGKKVVAIKFKIATKEEETIALEKLKELQREAKRCYSNCKGTCAPGTGSYAWEKIAAERGTLACFWCKKFEKRRAEFKEKHTAEKEKRMEKKKRQSSKRKKPTAPKTAKSNDIRENA
jgi:plasmid replication initiation protein